LQSRSLKLFKLIFLTIKVLIKLIVKSYLKLKNALKQGVDTRAIQEDNKFTLFGIYQKSIYETKLLRTPGSFLYA